MCLLIWLLVIGYIIGFCIGIFYWKKDKEECGYYVDTAFDALCAIIFIPFISMVILFMLWILIVTKLILYVILFGFLISIGIAVVYWNEIKEFFNKDKE